MSFSCHEGVCEPVHAFCSTCPIHAFGVCVWLMFPCFFYVSHSSCSQGLLLSLGSIFDWAHWESALFFLGVCLVFWVPCMIFFCSLLLMVGLGARGTSLLLEPFCLPTKKNGFAVKDVTFRVQTAPFDKITIDFWRSRERLRSRAPQS